MMKHFRVKIENYFAQIKNTWRHTASSDGERVLVGEIGQGRNDPVVFCRQEIVVAAFLHNCLSLVRQNNISTYFGFIRSGVPNLQSKVVLPTLENYIDNMQTVTPN